MHRLVSVVGIVRNIRIVAISGKEKCEAILRILAKKTPKSVIAIFTIHAGVRKIAVHDIRPRERRPRHRFHQFAVLREKRLAEIVIAPVINRIPFVRIPAFAAINDKRIFGRMNAESLLPAHFANITVKRMPFPPGFAPHISAFRTPCRRRDFYFFVKLKIFWLNDKTLLTILANFSFGIHGFNLTSPYSLIRAN